MNNLIIFKIKIGIHFPATHCVQISLTANHFQLCSSDITATHSWNTIFSLWLLHSYYV